METVEFVLVFIYVIKLDLSRSMAEKVTFYVDGNEICLFVICKQQKQILLKVKIGNYLCYTGFIVNDSSIK